MASIVWIPVIFISTAFYLYWLSINLPSISRTHNPILNSTTTVKFPANLEELQALASLLSQYRVHHVSYVLLLFSSAYLFKQTFAIPGSVFLNLLGGALFGQWLGFGLTCVLSASGATCCFLLSKYCGKTYVVRFFPQQLANVQKKIEENMDSLFFFLLFLRLFPITPNWFLNIAAPLFNIPVHYFFFSVLLGLLPYNFITVNTGCLLSELSSMDEIFTWWTLFKLIAMANAALLPGILIKRYHDHRQKQKLATRYNLDKEPEKIR
jgi:uncharacterized membrane protein YdjX (TVP38/TMEM64 family)